MFSPMVGAVKTLPLYSLWLVKGDQTGWNERSGNPSFVLSPMNSKCFVLAIPFNGNISQVHIKSCSDKYIANLCIFYQI